MFLVGEIQRLSTEFGIFLNKFQANFHIQWVYCALKPRRKGLSENNVNAADRTGTLYAYCKYTDNDFIIEI